MGAGYEGGWQGGRGDEPRSGAESLRKRCVYAGGSERVVGSAVTVAAAKLLVVATARCNCRITTFC